MENRAARYRGFAAALRAMADNLSYQRERQDILVAADVWDRLATFAELGQAHVPRPNTATPRSSRLSPSQTASGKR
jgi:hypothetical protein